MGGIFKQREFEHTHSCENITTIDMCQDLADRVSLNCGCHVFIYRVAGFDEEERTCNLWMDHGTCADY